MAIELTPPQSNKTNASAEAYGKKPGKPSAGETDGINGFSFLMHSLSTADAVGAQSEDGASPVALDDASDTSAADVGLMIPGQSMLSVSVVPLASSTPAMTTVPLVSSASDMSLTSLMSTGSAASSESADAALPKLSAQAALNTSPVAADNLQLAAQIGTETDGSEGGVNFQQAADQQAVQDHSQASAPLAFTRLMSQRMQSASSQAQLQESNDMSQPIFQVALTPATDSAPSVLLTEGVEMQRLLERPGRKSGSVKSGLAGLDAGLGLGNSSSLSRSDAVFVVPSAAATVANTAVAETVSYWVSHGVQRAELTLDGFGDSPIEVHISMNGDQTQIDFRSDQTGVRQVLESAAAQLKELLSGQGLQLAGVSVGTSGQRENSGESRRARANSQRMGQIQAEVLTPAANRAAHPSVGRSLDLFV